MTSQLLEIGRDDVLGFYGLLFVSGNKSDGENLRTASVETRIDQYLRMAERLGQGLRRTFRLPLVLVSNDSAYLESRLAARGRADWKASIALLQFEFTGDLPQTARFHSATNKIFLFRLFSRLPGYSVLVDLDVMCLPGAAAGICRLVESNRAAVYDISEQVMPVFGEERIRGDLRKFGVESSVIRWFGGEFIGGNAGFFGRLADLAEPAALVYGEVFESLHHHGDEMITSACLNRMLDQGEAMDIVDRDRRLVMRRYWGIPTALPERRLEANEEIGLLHLPGAKHLLRSRIPDQDIIRILRYGQLLPRRLAQLFYRALGWMAYAVVRRN